jgi:flagellar biosynthesis/type III secretory pathway protein FliH
MVKKGRAQGLQQGVLAMQQVAIDMVVANFADLETLARAKITAIDDLERLQYLIVDLGISHTQEQMKRVLLSLDV